MCVYGVSSNRYAESLQRYGAIETLLSRFLSQILFMKIDSFSAFDLQLNGKIKREKKTKEKNVSLIYARVIILK